MSMMRVSFSRSGQSGFDGMDPSFLKRHWNAKVNVQEVHEQKGAFEMRLSACGINLARVVFQVHGVDLHRKSCLLKQLRRVEVLTFFVKLELCLVGMEACDGAHYWARKLSERGHTVKLMTPQFVKPSVKTNKADAVDAQAFCEAVTRSI